ncbi:hypothetical protein M3Y99_00623100 [Aphelenchoides fujianensis]|nr:hypothetical protein M3Y99_00623100 [Aphelenchoides fujianensis]
MSGNSAFFILLSFLLIAQVLAFDLDPDVTANRKLDPELAKEEGRVKFRVSFDGRKTEIWNVVNGSHWTLDGEHTSDAELEPYRPRKG